MLLSWTILNFKHFFKIFDKIYWLKIVKCRFIDIIYRENYVDVTDVDEWKVELC